MTPRRRRKTRNPLSKVKRQTAKRFLRRQALPQSIPEILQANWDRTKTVLENYSHLGLTRRLNGTTGGKVSETDGFEMGPLDLSEWSSELDGGLACGHDIRVLTDSAQAEMDDTLQIDETKMEEGVIERDADGNIVSVKILKRAPSKSTKSKENEFILALEEHAKCEVKRKVFQSSGEVDFIKACVEKYADDYEAMARDIRLNYLQWTPNQIRRKVETYQRIQTK